MTTKKRKEQMRRASAKYRAKIKGFVAELKKELEKYKGD